MESRSLQIKEKYQLYLNDQAHGDKLAINIDEIDTEMATLRESLAVLPETNPDWVEISSLAAMKLSFVKDLKELDEGFEAEDVAEELAFVAAVVGHAAGFVELCVVSQNSGRVGCRVYVQAPGHSSIRLR